MSQNFQNINPNLRKQINKELKSSKAIQDLFKKHKVNLEVVNFVPMCFADDLDVSARTMHGIIYFNSRLKDSDNIFHYAAHEITHTIEQCFGNGPTEGSTDDDYLDNIHEQHGFQTQTKFISETEGPQEANQYINRVLEHHSVPESEKEEKKEDLLRTSSLKLGKAAKDKYISCFNCWNPVKTSQQIKVRGKSICPNCYNKIIEYRKTIPCTCGHSYDKHGLKEGERSFPKYECKDQIYLYRTNKKCPCENYKPSVDDYSDTDDGQKLLRTGSFIENIRNFFDIYKYKCELCNQGTNGNKTYLGKPVCRNCFDTIVKLYKEKTPCVCGHLPSKHFVVEFSSPAPFMKMNTVCEDLIFNEDYRSVPKKCPCSKYEKQSGFDDYSDSNDINKKASLFKKLFGDPEDATQDPKYIKSCDTCGKWYESSKYLETKNEEFRVFPLIKIRGKNVCQQCYKLLSEYRKDIPCKCSHLMTDHSDQKYKCNGTSYSGYRSDKRCSCEQYHPVLDDYSDASDGKQLSLKFEKRDKSKPRKENIQELKDRIMHEIETGEELKRKEKYRERPSKKLSPKKHPYARKNIVDLARKVMEATEKKDDNLQTDDADICKDPECGHHSDEHIVDDYGNVHCQGFNPLEPYCGCVGFLKFKPNKTKTDKYCYYCNQPIINDLDLNYVRGKLLCRYDYAKELDRIILKSMRIPCHRCGHSVQDHNGKIDNFHKGPRKYLGKGKCSVLLDSDYRSQAKECSCECYI
jgi:hypothetical protein